MTTTIDPTSTGASDVAVPTRRLDEARIAGIGALVFATLVITTNVVHGSAPTNDADAAEVVAYITDHRAANVFGTVAFAIGAPFLLSFAGAFYGRLRALGRAEDAVWARIGAIGALLILPTFAAAVVNRLVLLVGTDEVIGSPELVTLVWRLDRAAFTLNTLPLSVALVGFGIAGARAGALPAWFARWVPVAAVCGVATAASAIAGLEGAAIGFGGLVPFITWMVLLLTAGVRQLRSAR